MGDYNDLVERVAAAMCEATGQSFHGPDILHDIGELERDGFRHRARAAIRVVVEACAAEANAVSLYAGMFGGPDDNRFHEYGTGAMECLARIRALLPTAEENKP